VLACYPAAVSCLHLRLSVCGSLLFNKSCNCASLPPSVSASPATWTMCQYEDVWKKMNTGASEWEQIPCAYILERLVVPKRTCEIFIFVLHWSAHSSLQHCQLWVIIAFIIICIWRIRLQNNSLVFIDSSEKWFLRSNCLFSKQSSKVKRVRSWPFLSSFDSWQSNSTVMGEGSRVLDKKGFTSLKRTN